ncbi:MAG TPA: hypothetical protein VL093_08855, partial [Flavipsychrobacter sp.]|nr:hypothetical protein [Flavipsychrobacter sp.]
MPLPPVQLIFVWVKAAVRAAGSVMVTELVAVHPCASFPPRALDQFQIPGVGKLRIGDGDLPAQRLQRR